MAATIISFRWLDILEKEFDKSFVDLDLILGEFEEAEENDWLQLSRSKLEALSSCFAQLTHKSQTIFQTNAKLEAELVNLRHELTHSQASCRVFREESHDMLMQLHATQLELYTRGSSNEVVSPYNVDHIKRRLENELEQERAARLVSEKPQQEVDVLRKENEALRKQMLALQSEVCGAKLAAKYLDKELAGRIQQIQLVTRGDLKSDQHEKLWRQIEAEIHLNRHKTVVRSFRNNSQRKDSLTNEPLVPFSVKDGAAAFHRFVPVDCPSQQEFGLSITGGRDYGLPILISYIHPQTPAKICDQFYVGDVILSVDGRSLKDVTHAEAVRILSGQKGKMTLEVVFIPPDEEDDGSLEGQLGLKYKIFDEEVDSVASSFLQNGRLSRASIDSVRGSTDNIILGSPRKLVDMMADYPENEIISDPGFPDTDFESGSINHHSISEVIDQIPTNIRSNSEVIDQIPTNIPLNSENLERISPVSDDLVQCSNDDCSVPNSLDQCSINIRSNPIVSETTSEENSIIEGTEVLESSESPLSSPSKEDKNETSISEDICTPQDAETPKQELFNSNY